MAEKPLFLHAHEGTAPFAKRRLGLLLLVAFLVIPMMPSAFTPAAAAGYSFLSHTFTPCGATGKSGPTLANCTSAYTTSWDDSTANFNVSNGIQLWTVPVSGLYEVTAAGARGGGTNNGSGRIVKGRVMLTEGDVLKILVGQEGVVGTGDAATGGGGGASFVATSTNTPMFVGGGGGGSAGSYAGLAGSTTTCGGTGAGSGTAGGCDGAGATAYRFAGGGAGFTSNGTTKTHSGEGSIPQSFVNGGVGGGGGLSSNTSGGHGGFGGGAGSCVCSTGGGGGGGGYGGGGAGGPSDWGAYGGGGGGGSFVMASATSVNTNVGTQAGAGYVSIVIVAPVVTSFTANVATPTNATSLTYTINFSESVTGFTSSDVALSGTSSTWTLGSFSGSGAGPYTMVLNSSGTTTGTVVATIAANSVTGVTSGLTGPPVPNVNTMNIDVDPPTASSGTTPSSPAAAMSLTFGVNFSETVSGIAAGDFSNAGTALGCVFTPSAASGTSVNVVVTQCQEGTLTLRLAANGVSDAAGNTGPVSALNSSTITLAASALSVTAGDKSINYGGTWTDSYTQSGLIGSDTVTVTYSYSGTTTLGTSYGPSATKPTAGGTYSIIPAVSYGGANANRYALTRNNGALTIARVAQSALTLTSTTATFGADLSLTTSGGSGTGAVTYAVSSGTCTVSGTTLTPGDAGSLCTVTATKTADDNYTAISSVATTVTVNRTAQATLTVTSTNATYGSTLALTASGGSGAGSVSWTVVSGTCTVSGSTLTPGNAGSSCIVRATKALDTNYNAVNSADTAITINRATQAALSVTSTSATYGASYSLTSSGGSGAGAVTWTVVSGTCTVSGSTLTPGNAGSSCIVRATKAQDTNYLVVDSADTTVSIARAAQSALTVTSTTATYGTNLSLTTTGGSGTGAVSWQIMLGTCTVSASSLTPGDAGSACQVKATKAQDTNYLVEESVSTTVNINRASQATLTVTSTNATYGSSYTLTTSGGSGTGSVSWTVTSGTCSVSGSTLTPGNAGSSCVVRASKALDTNYNAVNSSNTTVSIGRANQSGINITSASFFTTGNSLSLTATGGQSSGSLSWAVTAGTCALSGTTLTSAARGGITCTVEVTRAGDSNYNAGTESATISVNKISQILTFRSTPPSPANPGGTYTVSVDSDAFLAPTVAISNSSSSVCSIAAGVVTFNTVGSCVISASQAGNDTTAAGSASQTVNVVAVAAAAPASTAPAVSVPVAPASTTPSVVTTTTAPATVKGSAPAVTTTTVPPVTTTSTTTTTIPADPGQAQTDAFGGKSELDAGETVAIVQGQKVKVDVKTEGDVITIKLPNDVAIQIGSTDPKVSSAKVSADGVLRIFGGEVIEVNAGGLAPDTTYTVFMFSTPTELGRGVAGQDGTVSSTVRIPKDAKAESHTFQVNGVGPDGEVVTVSMGFDVLKRQDNTRWAIVAISLGILLALLGGRPVLGGRRRRRA